MTQQINAKRLEDGWHTIINGEVNAKTSISREEALRYGDRVQRGLARWETLDSKSQYIANIHNPRAGYQDMRRSIRRLSRAGVSG